MQHFKVALLQLFPTGTLEGNLQKGLAFCRKAREMGADLALFPEMWSNGYCITGNADAWKADAVSADGAFVRSFGRLAKELHMAIGVTFLEAFEPQPRNSLCLFDCNGERAFIYAKVHTCDFGEECYLTAGDAFYTATLHNEQGDIRIGGMICYDREFPESARILMLQGAELILVPNACPMEINRLSQLRARAFENMVGIATCNYPKGVPDCNGHSTAFDGIAYLSEEPCSRDMLVIEAGEQEGIYMADFPIGLLRKYRSLEVHGNAYRHPQKYHMLISERIEKPFIRANYRK